MEHDTIHKTVKKIMALPFLPPEVIQDAFNNVSDRITDGPLRVLLDYVSSTWIHSSVWPPKCWSVFGQTVRTNNDVEGWHRRINGKAGRAQLQFYILVPLLAAEGRLVSL